MILMTAVELMPRKRPRAGSRSRGLANPMGLAVIVIALSVCAGPAAADGLAGGAIDDPTERRIDELLGKLTLEEKAGQLVLFGGTDSPDHIAAARAGLLGGCNSMPVDVKEILASTNRIQRVAVEESRLGIPLLFAFDVIHGCRTIFPIQLGMASSFDPGVLETMARISAREARSAGIRWTFAPMVDVARDARWGRVAEGCGEDPYLNAVMAAAQVRGYQGKRLTDPESLAACSKHYAAYGACDGGRDYDTTDLSEMTLRDVYLPPHKAAVEAGVATIMSAFNDIGGVAMTANRELLTDVLRREWGFDGAVVSDANSIHELLNHGVAATRADAARLSLIAGTDIDLGSNCYKDELAGLVRRGDLDVRVLDEACRRVLRLKMRLGLFENPYTDPTLLDKTILRKDHIEAARDAARKSIVLLKNNNEILPLRKTVKAIALIGPLAHDRQALMGAWAPLGKREDVATVLEGIQAAAPDVQIHHAAGCLFSARYFETERQAESMKTEGFAEAVEAARDSDVVVLVLGEHGGESGEAGSRASIDLPGVQRQLAEAVIAVGRPTVVVLMNGRPLALEWLVPRVDGLVEAWHGGIQAGPAIADVLFGDVNPGGKLPVTFPRQTGHCPLYYNHKNSGRPRYGHPVFAVGYFDTTCEPMFPFGFGLSYTTFEYANLKIDPAETGVKGRIGVSLDVTNTGKRAGEEVAQLYIRDLVGSLTRPVKELKGFQRISLNPGETKAVRFELGPEHLGFHDRSGKYVVEPGAFKVWVGGSSVGGLEGDFRLVGPDGVRQTLSGDDAKKSTGFVGGIEEK